MVRIKGFSHQQIDRRIARMDRLVADALIETLKSVTIHLNGRVLKAAVETDQQIEQTNVPITLSVDDLGVITSVWTEQVKNRLVPLVAEFYKESADRVNKSVTRSKLLEIVPEVSPHFAEDYLEKANNRLVRISDHIWETARSELVTGVHEGESIPELAKRLTGSQGITEARAVVIARTEVISACNAGSLDQVKTAELTGIKEWLATNDIRTRQSHRDADGQRVNVDDSFSVGGFSLNYPGDPLGPPEEIIQCRCTLVYDLDSLEENVSGVTAAGDPLAGLPNIEGTDMPVSNVNGPVSGPITSNENENGTSTTETVDSTEDVHTGGMIALVPSQVDIDRLVLAGGESADQLHLTLYYLGEAIEIDLGTQQLVTQKISEIAQSLATVTANIFGAALWNPLSDTPAIVLSVGGESLESVQSAVQFGLYEVPTFDLCEQHCPWVPHICLAYSDDINLLEQALERVGPVTFDRLRVAWAGAITDLPLYNAGNMVAASVDLEAVTVPYEIRQGESCPPSKPYGVYKQGTSERMGCHVTENDAKNQMEALYANEQKASSDLQINEEEFAWDASANEKKLPSPLPLSKARAAYAYVDASQANNGSIPKSACKLLHHDIGDGGSVGAANVDACSAAIGAIHGARSPLNIPTDAKKTAYNHLAKHMRDAGKVPPDFATYLANGGSMTPTTVDMSPPVDVPTVNAENSVGWEGILVLEGIETGDGRTFAPNSLTWDQPPLALRWTPTDIGEHGGAVIAGRIDEIWRDSAQPSLIRARGVFDTGGPNGAEAFRLVDQKFLKGVSVDVDSIKNADVELVYPDSSNGVESIDSENGLAMLFNEPESMVFHAGRIRAATLVDIPAFSEAQIWISQGNVTLDMNNMNGPMATGAGYGADAMSAGLVPVDDEAPPSEWFTDPALMEPTSLTITDDGRIFGHGALWGSCHTGFADACVTPPLENEHAFFRQGEVLTSDGERIAVGQITLGTGHAPTFGIDPRKAVEHYDNTGTVVADVVTGNDEYGIWVSGALRPGLDADRVRALRAAKLSGDWRRIGGSLRLVAFLAVNVPGFAIPRLKTEVKEGKQLSLVASGIVTDGAIEQSHKMSEQTALRFMRDSLVKRLGRDTKTRVQELRTRVLGG